MLAIPWFLNGAKRISQPPYVQQPRPVGQSWPRLAQGVPRRVCLPREGDQRPRRVEQPGPEGAPESPFFFGDIGKRKPEQKAIAITAMSLIYIYICTYILCSLFNCGVPLGPERNPAVFHGSPVFSSPPADRTSMGLRGFVLEIGLEGGCPFSSLSNLDLKDMYLARKASSCFFGWGDPCQEN